MSTVYHLLDEREVFSEGNGGAISRWAANALRNGNEVVVCPEFDSSWGFPQERLYKLPYWHLTDAVHPILYRLPWQLQQVAYRQVFRPFMSGLKPGDVVYVHNRPEAAAVLGTMARSSGVRIVLHMHNSHLLRANKGQLEALREMPIVFCSHFLEREVKAALPDFFRKTYVIHNGADGRKFTSRQKECRASITPRVVFSGRLVRYKGVHILVEAMRILSSRGIHAHCQVIGGARFGSNKRTLYTRRLVRDKPSNVEFLGYQPGQALAELLRAADIFCCPSVWNDPFPLAPLEAMATGLPVVATNGGGLVEMLACGGGILVARDDVGALAAALERLIVDEPYRKALGKEAFASFQKNFVWSNVRQQYDRVLRSVCSEVSV